MGTKRKQTSNNPEELSFKEPTADLVLVSASPLDIAVFKFLKARHLKRIKETRPILWEVTASDILKGLPKDLQKYRPISIRRSLRKLESLGLIKVREMGYNRLGYTISRFDVRG